MDDCADLFCELFDAVAPVQFAQAAESWLADAPLMRSAAEVERAALEGTLNDERLRGCLERPDLAFAALLGLDGALAHVNPLLAGGAPPPALAEIALRYAETSRLDSGARTGALLPRFAHPGRRGQLPEDLADAFGAVIRVGAPHWDACSHAMLPAPARLGRSEREGGLRVATTPMIREPEELHWEVDERSGIRFYRIHPVDSANTARRVNRVIDGWVRGGAAVGLAPELCLSPRLLERWQEALRERAGAPGTLRLVVAGSGNVEGATPPANTAVLLDARTGEVLVTQRKIHPFNFSEQDLELWGLGERLAAPVDEDLNRGERICVVEAGGVRLAILVCEDLARLHAFSSALHAHGVSLILVPVFARPTKDRRWERAKAEIYSDATGSTVVVANSLVIAAILQVPGPVGTAIAVTPGQAAVGHAAEPDDVVVFALGAAGPSVAHERAEPA